MAGLARGGGNRVEQVPVVLPRDESAPESWLRNLRLSGFTVLILGLLILGIIVLAPNLRIFFEQRAQIALLEQSVEQSEKSVTELSGEVARWSDPAYIESQARERLYYVFPGDVSYLVVGNEVVDDQAAAVDDLPISDHIQTTKVNWIDSVLSSVFTAGLTVAAPEDLAVVP